MFANQIKIETRFVLISHSSIYFTPCFLPNFVEILTFTRVYIRLIVKLLVFGGFY